MPVFAHQRGVFSDRTPRALYQPRSHVYGTLARNPAAANRCASRVFPAGKTRERRDMFPRPEAGHIVPLKRQPDCCQPADTGSTHLGTHTDMVTFFSAQCPQFAAELVPDDQVLLQQAQVM